MIQPIDIEKYYQKEIDERQINENFNFSIITDVLKNHSAFTKGELDKLSIFQKDYKSNILELSENEYKKDLPLI